MSSEFGTRTLWVAIAEDVDEEAAWQVLNNWGEETVKLATEEPVIEISTPHQFAVKFLHEYTRAEAGQGVLAEGPSITYEGLRHAFHEAMTAAIQAYAPGARYFY